MLEGESVQVFMLLDTVLTEMLTVKQAAYHYNISFRTIENWINEGKIIPIEIEHRHWLKKQELELRIKKR